MDLAYFRPAEATGDDAQAGEDILIPQPHARALWAGGDQMRGSAVSGALAREAERVAATHGASGLRPARWTLDLFRPATMAECVTRGRVVRAGRRLCLVDVVLCQGGTEIGRASALFLAGGEVQGGPVWTPEIAVDAPPADLRPASTEPRLYSSDGTGWTGSAHAHVNGRRKRAWLHGVPVVRGESPSPFQLTAMAGDVANIVTNWGADGLAHINADVGIVLARLPAGEQIGLAAELRIEHEGLVAGVATLFDRSGVFGTASVSALPSAAGPIDPRLLGEPLPEEHR